MNVQVTADTIYTSKQFQRIKDNFDVSKRYNITIEHLFLLRILYFCLFAGKIKIGVFGNDEDKKENFQITVKVHNAS